MLPKLRNNSNDDYVEPDIVYDDSITVDGFVHPLSAISKQPIQACTMAPTPRVMDQHCKAAQHRATHRTGRTRSRPIYSQKTW